MNMLTPEQQKNFDEFMAFGPQARPIIEKRMRELAEELAALNHGRLVHLLVAAVPLGVSGHNNTAEGLGVAVLNTFNNQLRGCQDIAQAIMEPHMEQLYAKLLGDQNASH